MSMSSGEPIGLRFDGHVKATVTAEIKLDREAYQLYIGRTMGMMFKPYTPALPIEIQRLHDDGGPVLPQDEPWTHTITFPRVTFG